jgi:MoxR-like ATPase
VVALLELATALPTTVQFKPLPPQTSYLLDIRNLLPEVLATWKKDLSPDFTPGAETPELPHISDKKIKERLRPFLKQAAEVASGLAVEEKLVDHLFERLADAHPEVVRVLFRFVKASALRSDSQAERSSKTALRNSFRQDVHLDDEAPILVIGRPDDFGGYDVPVHEAPADEQEPTDFRRLMDRAGYPNRFYFTGTKSHLGICDRKTWSTYRETQRGVLDVGFIYMGRLDNGHPVMVATGTTSLGTYASVRLLLQNRPDVQQAVGEFIGARSASCVDIGFQCHLESLSGSRPFPLAHSPQHLRIEILNPNDMVGYAWSRAAHRQLRFLLAKPLPATARELHADECMEWAVAAGEDDQEAGGRRLHQIRIEVKQPQEINRNQLLLPSEPMARLVAKIRADLQADRQVWSRRLEEWGTPPLTGIEEDRSYRTFHPILLLGATGTGKQWIAELIAKDWTGETLEGEQDSWRASGQGRLAVLNAARKSLNERLDKWKEAQADEASGLLTFSAVACPETLLDSELFGVAKETATGVAERPGAFIMAGTGVLFLDEFLELPSEQQARLLVALQTGRVRPAGAGREYAYVSRLVAATNRASTEDELMRLVSEKVVRADLVARFSRRYALPPLRERALEIIPLLIELLRADRLLGAEQLERGVVRISRPALEALASYHYPENIRDLRRLADNLPDDLVEAFRQKIGPDDKRPFAALAQHAICLKHLAHLGVVSSPPKTHEELEFFEFQLAFPDADSIPRQSDPDVAKFLFPELYGIRASLRAMKKCADAWPAGGDLTGEELAERIRKEPFWDGFRKLHHVLQEIHAGFHKDNKKGLRLREIREAIKAARERMGERFANELPFARYEELFYKSWKSPTIKRDYVEKLKDWNSIIDAAVAELQKRKKQDAEIKRPGKPQTLHNRVTLSILLGHALPDNWPD